MATHANVSATAQRNARRNTAYSTPITPKPVQAGYLLHTYTSASLGRCVVVARLCNAKGMVTGYKVLHKGTVYMVPGGNLAAHGTLFVPNAIAHKLGYVG